MTKDGVSKKEIEEVLIENFVGLQKAITNLSMRFDALSQQIARLLGVFELAAKNVAESSPTEYSKEIVDRLNSLIEQNKDIATALVALEERTRRPVPTIMPPRPLYAQPGMQPRPALPRPGFPNPNPTSISQVQFGQTQPEQKKLLSKF